MAVWLQVCCAVSSENYPTKGLPTVLFIDFWPHSFHEIMYYYYALYYYLLRADATISQHKHSANIQSS
jgi:hypothetical protein